MSKKLADHLSVYKRWYPKTYQLAEYPLEGRKTLTVKNRQEIYQRLTIPQRELIEVHKKYQMGSFFLNHHYLIDEEWLFETVNIDENYNRKKKRYKLYCQCGKAVKYQFILKSKKNKEEIALGITHFTDHLGVRPEVASEIKKGINQVDMALDELLWLKEKKYTFPEDLWQQYLFTLYRNQQLIEPVEVNHVLAKRVLTFRNAEMPIFVADYLALLNEMRLIEKASAVKGQPKFIGEKKGFEDYSRRFMLSEEVEEKTYHPTSVAFFEKWQQLEETEQVRVFEEFQQFVHQKKSKGGKPC
ncbi:hypothetical protein ACYSNO_03920 [Enterococcus sp. LJL98]